MTKEELVVSLSKMSLEEIAEAILQGKFDTVKSISNIPQTKQEKIKFFGDIEKLKPIMTKNLKGVWTEASNGLFKQFRLKKGGNVNFYENGTVLIQGDKVDRDYFNEVLPYIFREYDKQYSID
jgi:hypothetical protein